MKRTLSLVLTFLIAATANAAEIKVVTANPLHEGLLQIAEQYKRDTGHDVRIQAATTAELNRILTAGEPADILVGTAAMADQAVKDSKVSAEGRTLVGRVGIAVVVRRGARVPNVVTTEGLRQAVLAADAVVYNTAGSGQAVQRLFEQMGISQQIQSKSARPTNAAQTMERLIQGKGNEIGFGLFSEIKPYEEKGVQVAGRLPADVQSYANYDAVVFTGSKSTDAARDFIRYLTTTAAKKMLAATGVD